MTVAKVMGVARKVARRKDPLDFEPTPPDPVFSLIQAERARLDRMTCIWEPAVGQGHIAKILAGTGLPVVGSDIVDRGYPGTLVKSFLDFTEPLGDGVITNPPFGRGLPARFVLHCFKLKIPYCALLLKGTYLHQKRALNLVSRWKPARYYHLSYRVDFTGEGRSPWQMTWYVWDAYATGTEVQVLPRPAGSPGEQQADLFGGAE